MTSSKMTSFEFDPNISPEILDANINGKGLLFEMLFLRPVVFTLCMVIFVRALYLGWNNDIKSKIVYKFALGSIGFTSFAIFISCFIQTDIYSSNDFYKEYTNIVKHGKTAGLGYTDVYNILAFTLVFVVQLTYFAGFGYNILDPNRVTTGLIATAVVYVPIMIVTFITLCSHDNAHQIGYIKEKDIFFAAQAHGTNLYIITGIILVFSDFIWYGTLIKNYYKELNDNSSKSNGFVCILVTMILYILFMLLNSLPNGADILYISAPVADLWFIVNNAGLLVLIEPDNAVYNFIYKPFDIVIKKVCCITNKVKDA